MAVNRYWMWLPAVLIGLIGFEQSLACEIKLILDNPDSVIFKAGDTVMVTVKVNLPHQNCTNSIQQTQFECQGLKIAASTPWKDLKQLNWQKKLKVVIQVPITQPVKLKAYRLCDVGGDEEVLVIPVKVKEY